MDVVVPKDECRFPVDFECIWHGVWMEVPKSENFHRAGGVRSNEAVSFRQRESKACK